MYKIICIFFLVFFTGYASEYNKEVAHFYERALNGYEAEDNQEYFGYSASDYYKMPYDTKLSQKFTCKAFDETLDAAIMCKNPKIYRFDGDWSGEDIEISTNMFFDEIEFAKLQTRYDNNEVQGSSNVIRSSYLVDFIERDEIYYNLSVKNIKMDKNRQMDNNYGIFDYFLVHHNADLSLQFLSNSKKDIRQFIIDMVSNDMSKTRILVKLDLGPEDVDYHFDYSMVSHIIRPDKLYQTTLDYFLWNGLNDGFFDPNQKLSIKRMQIEVDVKDKVVLDYILTLFKTQDPNLWYKKPDGSKDEKILQFLNEKYQNSLALQEKLSKNMDKFKIEFVFKDNLIKVGNIRSLLGYYFIYGGYADIVPTLSYFYIINQGIDKVYVNGEDFTDELVSVYFGL